MRTKPDNLFLQVNNLSPYDEYAEPERPESTAHPATVEELRNNLGSELSPELKLHASNPIEWQSWSPEAFKAAAARDVPVFLSIGRSSAHWCHVMMKECFSDVEVAGLMNSGFVAVKVDCEERAGLANLYPLFNPKCAKSKTEAEDLPLL